ncbi:MAG: TRAP transporter small permease [Proteobacteria bacterium]|nr:TRAP transporter small permease [Pseudomonadota bacterium]
MDAIVKPLCGPLVSIFSPFATLASYAGPKGFFLLVCALIAVGLLVALINLGFLGLLVALPQLAVTALIVFAILNLLVGVFLRYVVGYVTYTCDLDNVPFTWVEEFGEMSLAWLTLVGAAIGIRSRSHFTLHFLTLSASARRALEIFNHLLIAAIGAASAWYGLGLFKLNWELETPGLGISVGYLYASAIVGGVLIVVYALSMIVAPTPENNDLGH